MPKRSNSEKGMVEVDAWGASPAPTVAKSVDWVRRTWGWTWTEVREQSGDLVRVQAQAVAIEVALMQALALAEAEVQARAKARAKAQAKARAVSQAKTEAEVKTEAIARAKEQERRRSGGESRRQLDAWSSPWVQPGWYLMSEAERRAEAKTQARVEARVQARAQAWVQAWVKAGAQVQMHAQAGAKASTWALELAEVHKTLRAWIQALGQAQAQTWLSVGALKAREVEVKRTLWPRHRQDYWWLIQIITPIARLPPEILHQIFLILIDNDNDSPSVLMRVSKYWYNIVTGIWASLKLGTTTPKDAVTAKLERNQWLLDVVLDTEIDRDHTTPSEDAYQAIFAAMRATSRWRSLVVETTPAYADLSEDLIDRGLQQCSNLAMSRLRTLIINRPCDVSPLLRRLWRILDNTGSRELTTVTINSPAVISFLVPNYLFIFRSVTVLSLDAQGLRSPKKIDLLRHLCRLEVLTASHLPLPDYPYDADWPFLHTLRHLTLKSVSIQWMSGKTFHVLESCNLIFPPGHHDLHPFRTILPNCKHLSFEDCPLDILNGVLAHKLTSLSMVCSLSHKWREGPQLVRFSSQVLRWSRLVPQVLHISIEDTDQAWTEALPFMSKVEELVIYNAWPNSLGEMSLQPLVILPVQSNNTGTTATSNECNTPMCPSLRRFGLRYHHWLMPRERFGLIPVFISIIRSRQQSMFPMESFRIWTRSDENDPLELIEGSSVSSKGFKQLKKYASSKGRYL